MVKIILGILIGASIGAAIGYFGKCASGTCPLTSNPYASAIFGGIIGLIFTSVK